MALGMSYGVGTFTLLFYNGVILGGVFQDYIAAGETKFLLGWLLPHGVIEIPAITKRAAQSGEFDAIICLGAVIRGATPHFEYIAAEVTKGIAQVQLEVGIPIAYGVLTPDTIEQAIERAGTKAGNKGFDAAMGAIEMANLFKLTGSASHAKSRRK